MASLASAGESKAASTATTPASTWDEVQNGLGSDLFDFGTEAGHFEVDLLASVVIEDTLKVGPHTTLVLKSTNGQGELNGGGVRRVLDVRGTRARARLDGVAVRDGRFEPEVGGGCIWVFGDGAELTLDGGAVVSGCVSAGSNGVSAGPTPLVAAAADTAPAAANTAPAAAATAAAAPAAAA